MPLPLGKKVKKRETLITLGKSATHKTIEAGAMSTTSNSLDRSQNDSDKGGKFQYQSSTRKIDYENPYLKQSTKTDKMGSQQLLRFFQLNRKQSANINLELINDNRLKFEKSKEGAHTEWRPLISKHKGYQKSFKIDENNKD